MVARVLDVALTIMMLILRIDFALILAKNVVVNGALNLALGAAARAQYPWLKDKAPSRSYAFTRDIKFLIVQSIASVVVYNTSYLFLTHYMNLNEVTRYSNYVIIINLLSGIATIFAKAVSSGIGDLIAREDKEGALKIQEELGSFLAFFAATSALTFISVSPSFIELWVGPGFQVTDDKLLFIAGLYYYSVVRTYVITTLNSAGKFKDVTLSPVLESAINLALAFILVPRFGLLGILIGNAIGHAASNFLFYPMICYKKIFMQSSLVFYKKFFMRFVPFACFAALIIFTKSSSISRPEAPSLGSWILAAGLRYLVISAVFAAAYWLFSEDFRSLLVRMHGYLQTKIGKA
jgi:O-antigen/teichoic acid export membrane protein